MDHPNLDRLCSFQTQAPPSDEGQAAHTHSRVVAVAYHPCPACRTMMNRSAFARISGITLDVCKNHGTWFQPGQMETLLTYLRTPDGIAAWNDQRMRNAEASAHHEQQNVIRETWETPQIQQLGDVSRGESGLGQALKELCDGLISETQTRASGLTQPLKDRFGRKGKS